MICDLTGEADRAAWLRTWSNVTLRTCMVLHFFKWDVKRIQVRRQTTIYAPTFPTAECWAAPWAKNGKRGGYAVGRAPALSIATVAKGPRRSP